MNDDDHLQKDVISRLGHQKIKHHVAEKIVLCNIIASFLQSGIFTSSPVFTWAYTTVASKGS